MTALRWRPMLAADLDAVLGLAEKLFPDHPEAPERFAERLRLSPATCFLLEDEGRPAGYLVAYPQRRGAIPPLDGDLGALPPGADVLYLHDLAIAPDAAGRGAARSIVDALAGQARGGGLAALALVAVNSSTAFWEKLDFCVAESAAQAKLASYGADARYMLRELGTEAPSV